jgi:SPW repeat
MTAPTPSIEEHPDLTAMRHRYERVAETPVAQAADGLTLLTGVYLAMSPWVVGFTDHSALAMSNLFSGITVALLALGFASVYERTHGMAWVAPIIGVWTMVAPWVVADSGDPATSAATNNIIVGALCVILTLAMMSAGMRRRTQR